MRVTIIIPTYNEKENIGDLIIKTFAVVKGKADDYRILVVDDNSPDGTGSLVKKLQSPAKQGQALPDKFKNLYLLDGKKEGVGKAMIRGYRYALEKLGPDIIVSTEADFAYDPKYIPQAVAKIKEGYDVVVGSRHVGIGKTECWTLSRKINHWVANKFFATWVAGVREVYDHNGAFRAIRVNNVLDKVNFRKIKVTGFGFFSYFLFKLTQITDKFHELPVIYRFRKKGESKVSFNPKYFGTYLHDVFEYIILSFKIRLEKINIK